FKTVRRTYSRTKHMMEIARIVRPLNSTVGRIETIFPEADIEGVVRSIHDDAVYVGLNLPNEMVEEVRTFALMEPLHAIYDPNGPTFLYSDVSNGRAADGRPIPVGGVRDPARCPAVQALIKDPVLRAIVRSYLGHEPRTILPILSWSFASSMPDDERRR